jgi:hypothetical protein
MPKHLLSASISTIFAFILSQSAQAEIILPGRCHMGYCWENQFLGKTLLRTGNDAGKLYSVKLASRDWEMGTSPSSSYGKPTVSYVYCSTTKPAYIFQADGTYFAHLLNPGGDWFGYNMSDYPIYWATCHNFVGPNFFSEEMTSRAIQLGYPLDLPSEQIELDNVLEILRR